MNRADLDCEGCYYMGIWGCCRYCNNKWECKQHNKYVNKYEDTNEDDTRK